MKTRPARLIIAAVLILIAVLIAGPLIRKVTHKLEPRKTLEQRLAQYGPAARERLKPLFAAAGIAYPPKKLVFVGIKKDDLLHVYASDGGPCRLVKDYNILAASGDLGPKLREGDRQVPEGIYRITFLNPNSSYHLSLRVDYPNEFDQEMAKKDGREKLGGDIMIHGSACSIGCLAIGDPASEELFVLAADTGIHNIEVILSPVDFRTEKLDPREVDGPEWTGELYSRIASELRKIPRG